MLMILHVDRYVWKINGKQSIGEFRGLFYMFKGVSTKQKGIGTNKFHLKN